MVHGLHAVPGGDLARPTGDVAQLPDAGHRAHAAPRLQRLFARRSHRGRRGHVHVRRPLEERQEGPRHLLRRRRLPPANAVGAAHQMRRGRRRARDRRRRDGAARAGHGRRPLSVPRHARRRHDRGGRDLPQGVRSRRAQRRRRRSARALPPRSARRLRRGHRGRLDAALRRADGLWRAARGLHGDDREVRAAHAGEDHRRDGRGERTQGQGAQDGHADPGAAHPPRQGDLEHLHGPGPPRQHGGGLRGLPRRRGLESDRRALPRARVGLGQTPPRRRLRGRAPPLRHGRRLRPRGRRGRSSSRGRGGLQHPCALRLGGLAVVRRDHLQA
mmetsp:Transcript_18450/g.58080  ORF Transcript_18450/g.58080 Transcript_18450/m.58080 type:complete len:330 (-) Transcript_18450:1831-2820(-)